MKEITMLALTIFCHLTGSQAQLPIDNIYRAANSNEMSLLGEGMISTGLNEFNAVFSPAMDEFFFSIRYNSASYTILQCTIEEGVIGHPEIAGFSGTYDDADPFISADGKYLYFCSNRPSNDQDTIKDWNIWRMEKKDNQWKNPEMLSFNTAHKNEMYPTVAANGNVYFHSDLDSPQQGLDFMRTNLYRSKYIEGEYKGYEKILPASTDRFPEWDPYISLSEDYLIFTSPRPGGYGEGDMYICFNKNNHEWSDPINMGEKINSSAMDYCPSLSPDGKILFFSSYRNRPAFKNRPESYNRLASMITGAHNGLGNIYFISSDIIEDLRLQSQ